MNWLIQFDWLQYEDPPKHVAEAQQQTMKRLRELKKNKTMYVYSYIEPPSFSEMV